MSYENDVPVPPFLVRQNANKIMEGYSDAFYIKVMDVVECLSDIPEEHRRKTITAANQIIEGQWKSLPHHFLPAWRVWKELPPLPKSVMKRLELIWGVSGRPQEFLSASMSQELRSHLDMPLSYNPASGGGKRHRTKRKRRRRLHKRKGTNKARKS